MFAQKWENNSKDNESKHVEIVKTQYNARKTKNYLVKPFIMKDKLSLDKKCIIKQLSF